MYERISNCPVCGKTEFRNFMICKDYTVSEESFAISECPSCRLKFTNPRPGEDTIGKYYESKDYISHTNASNNIINLVYKMARKFTLGHKYQIINKRSSQKGRLLDYGCGTGNFLYYCKNKGWDVTGVEPSTNAKIEAQKRSLDVHNSMEELQDEDRFDVITLWHVLEHVHDLNTVLKFLKNKLNKNGIICVAVPNESSFDSNYYKEHWAAYDVPRHLYHFNQSSMKTLMKMNRLKIEEVIPMKLDSFYVSMLSEKYKTGKNNFIQAFKTGLTSNNWAAKNNNNYSSLIYIIKK